MREFLGRPTFFIAQRQFAQIFLMGFGRKLRGRKSNADKITGRERKSNLADIRYIHFHLHTRKIVINFYADPKARKDTVGVSQQINERSEKMYPNG